MEATTQSNLGSLNTFTTDLHVVRNGQEQILMQGDPILEGDTLINKGESPVDVLLPAQAAGQAAMTLTLQPQANATLKTGVNATGEPITEVVSANPQDLSLVPAEDGLASAEIVEGEAGEMSGLLGAGLLAGGGLTGLGGLAALIGGGAVIGGLASSDDENDPNNPNNPGGPNGGGNGGEGNNNTNGVEGVIDQVNQIVDGTPLAPVTQVTGALSPVIGTVSGVVDQIAAADPTGLVSVVGGLLGGDTSTNGNSNVTEPNGLVGVVNELVQGIQDSSANSPLAIVTGPLTEALQNTVLAPLDTALETAAGALAPVTAADPTGLSNLVTNLLGGDGAASGGSTGGLPGVNGIPVLGDLLSGGLNIGGAGSTDPNATGLEGGLAVVGDAVDGTSLAPVATLTGALATGLDAVAQPLEQVAMLDPTGVTDLLSGLVGGVTSPASPNDANGLIGVVDNVLEGVAVGTADSPLSALTNPLTDVLQGTALPALDTGLETVASALEPLVNLDPTGTLQAVNNLLGDDATSANASGIPLLGDLPLIGQLLGGGTGGLLSGGTGADAPLPLVGTLPVVGDLVGGLLSGDLLGGGAGDLPLIGSLLGGDLLASGGDGGLPLIGNLPVVGDLLGGDLLGGELLSGLTSSINSTSTTDSTSGGLLQNLLGGLTA